jgi:hypothetical protein
MAKLTTMPPEESQPVEVADPAPIACPAPDRFAGLGGTYELDTLTGERRPVTTTEAI